MKSSRKTAWLVVAACLMLSFVGFFYAYYYYSWLLSTPGVAAEARQQYDLLSRAIGIPSLVLFVASVVGAVWLMFRRSAREHEGAHD